MFGAIEIGDARKVDHLLTTGCTVNVKDKVRTLQVFQVSNELNHSCILHVF